jgi:SRSO17 transposase
VLDLETDAVAASWTVVDDRLARWQAGFDGLFAVVAGRFAQVQSRRRARLYLLGLLSGVERKNSWTIAEQAGERSPDGMQRLCNFYRWDADAVRDDLRAYVLSNLGDPAGVVVADETGFLKKGTKSAGMQRQYSGTAGRIENCQLGVFLTYVSPAGRALIDRELYLPKTWTDDRDRCAKAGIGDKVDFATKPELAKRMLTRLLATHGRAAVPWFTADEAYGDNPGLRDWLDEQDLNYVMAVSCDARFATPTGPRRADELAASAPHPRLATPLLRPGQQRTPALRLAARRSRRRPASAAGAPLHHQAHRTGLLPLPQQHAGTTYRAGPRVRVAGSRWGVEETFQFAKNETGLDHYQVRRYDAWYRHITLSMLAAAFLAVTAHTERLHDQKGEPQTASST